MIERVFHQIWLGSPIPDHLAAYRQTWIDLHPSWEHRLWTDDDFGWLRNQGLYDAAPHLARNVGQLRSDIARYEILHTHGGIYLDMDMKCRKPIDGLIEGLEAFAAWEQDGVWVNNAVLGCVPSHPFMEDLVAELPASVRAHRGQRPNRMTGPHFVTPIHYRHPDVLVFPQRIFYPYGFEDIGTERERGPFPDSYAEHAWENQRKRRGIPLSA